MTVLPSRNHGGRRESLGTGACDYLAEMILELQQMALRLGAEDVSSHLQAAYLETRVLKRNQRRYRDGD